MTEYRCILTLATGKQLYLDLATNLARSFFWWHPDTDIVFKIITDQQTELPVDIRSKVEVVKIRPGEYGEGFSPKLSLDHFSVSGQNLFIDSDCLIFGNLDGLFNAFKGRSVSVVGGYVTEGDWFGDIKTIREKYGLSQLPKFNGGIYYLEKNELSDAVYKEAREIEADYANIGFSYLRGKPNDEVIMALAMALHNQSPIPDDGSILSDPQACPGNYHIDVLKGERVLYNPPPPHPLHQNWYPFVTVSPLVVHFLGYYTRHYPYRREVYRLQVAFNNKLNWFTQLIGLVSIEYPARMKINFKNWFRPVYRRIAGYREIKTSDRV